MLNDFKVFEFPEARYILLKELDTKGPIGRLLLNALPHLANNVMGMADMINCVHCAQPGEYIPQRGDGVSVHEFVAVGEILPGLILTHSELNWNDFISAYCAFVHEYVQAMTHNYDVRESDGTPLTDEERCFFEQSRNDLRILQNAVMPTLKLVELGIGYTELLQASSKIVEELQSWRQSRPTSLRLSRAYLDALGIHS